MCDQGLGSGSELENGGVLDSLFETLPIGLAMLDEAGRTVRVNEEAKRLLGFTKVPLAEDWKPF
jgi:PAS domain S-box-containing protein